MGTPAHIADRPPMSTIAAEALATLPLSSVATPLPHRVKSRGATMTTPSGSGSTEAALPEPGAGAGSGPPRPSLGVVGAAEARCDRGAPSPLRFTDMTGRLRAVGSLNNGGAETCLARPTCCMSTAVTARGLFAPAIGMQLLAPPHAVKGGRCPRTRESLPSRPGGGQRLAVPNRTARPVLQVMCCAGGRFPCYASLPREACHCASGRLRLGRAKPASASQAFSIK